ncbi:tuliposide A-converting enzyme b3, amyloplastic-like [Miscanthus floridulus]|uniref:tuliposide A-converting enzyme b3, amyloplastic-like n=1 Tax=Miscanthus floridulus TaxID=154761 RepID=UPI0034595FB5
MDPSSDIILDTRFFRIYSDRRIDRLMGTETVPAGFDPATGVTSKDVVIDSDAGLYVRLYLPDMATGTGSPPNDNNKKLPVLVYFHGGGFVTQSAASPVYQRFLTALAAKAGLLIVSVNYRLAPEHPLPAGYEDSFRALEWAASAGSAGDPDPWLSRHGDLRRIFLAGDSAGGNIVHNVSMMAVAASSSEARARIEGAVLLHAGFGGREPVDGEAPASMATMEKLWAVVCLEATDGVDDPRVNPLAAAAPSLRDLPCERVLVCAAELDSLLPRDRAYYEAIKASGWGGTVEWFESEGQDHVFFLFKPVCDEAVALMDRLAAFFAGK